MLHQQHVGQHERDGHVQLEASPRSLLTGHRDRPAHGLHLAPDHVQTDAAAGELGGLSLGGEAGPKEQLPHLLRTDLERLSRSQDAAGDGHAQDRFRIEAPAVVRERDPEASAVVKAQIPILLGLDRTTEALAAARKAVELDPADHETWFVYGRLHKGMGQATRIRLGSVPDRVAHTAECDVLIVDTTRDPKPDGGTYKKIVAATDGSATASEAARKAKQEEKLVFVLHVSGHFEDPKFT